MITYANAGNDAVWELYGKSTDAKPTNETIPNGSMFYEMDTKKLYMFDKETSEWLEQ